MCDFEARIEELRAEASRIKQEPTYQKLNVKGNRNPTEQRTFDAFRRRLGDIETQISDLNKNIYDRDHAKLPCEPQTVAWKVPKNTAIRHEMAQKKPNVFNANTHVIIKTSKIQTRQMLDDDGLDMFLGK